MGGVVEIEGEFLGRIDERGRWLALLEASNIAPKDDHRSFVTLIHGIGGMGKTQLLGHLVEIAEGSVSPSSDAFHSPLRCVSTDLEAERQRLPDRYPVLEGPSVGTLLYTIERAICEQLDGSAENAFVAFRHVLARILDLVDNRERIKRESEFVGPELTPQEAVGLDNAVALVAGLVGVHINVESAAAIRVAGTGVAGLLGRFKRADRGAGGIQQQDIDIALDPERALVSAFAEGIRTVSAKRGLVVAIDTAEIAQVALAAIREAAGETGRRVIWLIAGRFDTPADSGYQKSTVAKFERAISNDRLAMIAISAFDRRLQGDYLESRLQRAFDEGELEKLDRITRGIPLALYFVVEMLREGASLEELENGIGDEGRPNQLVRGLTERFLHHAEQVREGLSNPLQADLPAIFGLVVDETAEAGKIIGFDLQRRVLASLLDIEPERLRERLDELADRHDFVLAATGRVHREVSTVFSDHLLGSDQRLRYAGMHERAAAVIRAEMATKYETHDIGERLGDEAWRVLASALVRHEFWISNERGIGALANVWLQAEMLQPSFSRLLEDLAGRFYPTATAAEQRVLRGLPSGLGDFAKPLGIARISTAIPDEQDRLAALQALQGTPRDPELGVPAHARDCLLELLAARAAATKQSWPTVLAHVKKADALVDAGDTVFNLAIARLAKKVAGALIFPTNSFARRPGEGQAASRVAVERNPGDAESRRMLAISLRDEGDLTAALAEHEAAIARDPNDPFMHLSQGFTLQLLGDYEKGIVAHDRACQLDPENPILLIGKGLLLCRSGDIDGALRVVEHTVAIMPGSAAAHEAHSRVLCEAGNPQEGLRAIDRALEIEGSNSNYQLARSSCLSQLDRRGEALAAIDIAANLDPHYSEPLTMKGLLLGVGPNPEDAIGVLERALRFDPGDYEAWAMLGILHRVVRKDRDASTSSFGAGLRAGNPHGHPFKRAEWLALCRGALGDARAGIRELREVKEPRPPWVYRPELYDLIRRDPFVGLAEIEQIVAAADS